ncbi:MAG: response regulator [Christensenellaceae bacterium]|nr:response regulator [Christensenellaceae bacterium]
MYRAIIVDDEPEIRNGIIDLIDFEKYGFKIVGSAENGMEGLELAEELKPDLIITDVRMPFMDGLEMSKKIREILPLVNIIVISGFDEFEYAHKAMQIEITEYVLKPVTTEELCLVLEKVKNRMDENLKQKRDLIRLNKDFEQSLPLLREHLLSLMFEGNISTKKITELTNIARIDLLADKYVVAIIKTIEPDKNKPSDHLANHSRLAKIAIKSLCSEIVASQYRTQCLYYRDEMACLFMLDKDTTVNSIINLLESLRNVIYTSLDINVVIGLGIAVKDVTLVSESARSALSALDYSSAMGQNNVVWISNVESSSLHHLHPDANLLQSLSSYIRRGEENMAVDCVKKLVNYTKKNNMIYLSCQVYFLEVWTSILATAVELGINTDEVLPLNQWSSKIMYSNTNISQIEESLISAVRKIIVKNTQLNMDATERMILEGQEYIRKNFHMQNLTAETVSNHLHISTSYFNALFKKYTGNTFHQELNDIRMKEAMHLIKNTNLKTSEIAERIGLGESSYFSYSFKKYYGMSPLTARKSSEG